MLLRQRAQLIRYSFVAYAGAHGAPAGQPPPRLRPPAGALAKAGAERGEGARPSGAGLWGPASEGAWRGAGVPAIKQGATATGVPGARLVRAGVEVGSPAGRSPRVNDEDQVEWRTP
jgi:hypothetical protein